MSESAVAVVVLAAGQGSRMQSDLPKVLHRLGGVPLVGHALRSARNLQPEQIAQSIAQTGIGFMFAPNHHAAMKHVAPVRRELGSTATTATR